jgi:hypothetical protein
MKSDTTKNAAQDNQKTPITQAVYSHVPGLKLEHKTTNQDGKSVDLTFAMYQQVLGQQS